MPFNTQGCEFIVSYDDFVTIMMFAGAGSFMTGFLITGLIANCRNCRNYRNRIISAEQVLIAERI